MLSSYSNSTGSTETHFGYGTNVDSKMTITARRQELVTYLFIPAAALCLAIVLQYAEVDGWVSKHFYDEASGAWPWKEHWFTQTVLHSGAQFLVKAFGLGLLIVTIRKCYSKGIFRFPKPWVVALLALSIGPLTVGYLKSVTHLACPWDEVQFGGVVPHLRLFDSTPPNTPIGHGFPSAHASSGYAFIGLYFSAALFSPSKRFHALAAGISLGLLFGIAQQMRGAHFLSHDFFALSICSTTSGIVYAAFYPRELLRFFGYNQKS